MEYMYLYCIYMYAVERNCKFPVKHESSHASMMAAAVTSTSSVRCVLCGGMGVWSLLARRAMSSITTTGAAGNGGDELTAVSSIPGARLVMAEDAGSATISSQPFLPIVVGWSESSHRPLSKYTTVYTGYRLHALTVCTSTLQVWSSRLSKTAASSLFKPLNSALERPTTLLLHMFSAAPLVMLPPLQELLASCPNLSLGGVVFECGPSNFSLQTGIAASRLMYQEGAFSLPVHLAACSVGITVNMLVGRRRRQELLGALQSPLLSGIPMMFLYTENDTVVKKEWVESLIRDQQGLGRTVDSYCFSNGTHNRNIVTHYDLYRTTLSSFLTKHYQIHCSQ